MVALAPEHPTEAGSDRWLGPFLAAWQPGTGEPHEVREPATGRPLLMLNRSTPDDVRRATRAAKAAQAAWAGTSYQDRAGILRRAAEIERGDQDPRQDQQDEEGHHGPAPP